MAYSVLLSFATSQTTNIADSLSMVAIFNPNFGIPFKAHLIHIKCPSRNASDHIECASVPYDFNKNFEK
jgi:hypothetical protein